MKLAISLVEALVSGRQAARILEALPIDEQHGYDKDEELQQWAAVDRLLAAFRTVDSELTGKPAKLPKYAVCNECGEEVVFDAWVTAGGEIHSQYDENLCLGCGGSVGGKYTEVDPCADCSHGEHAADGVDPICPCCKSDVSAVR